MKNLRDIKTFLGKEFELLTQKLNDSGVKVNQFIKEKFHTKELKVSFIKKKTVNVYCNKIS